MHESEGIPTEMENNYFTFLRMSRITYLVTLLRFVVTGELIRWLWNEVIPSKHL